jgi:sirohydrochlorin ferrochelatase
MRALIVALALAACGGHPHPPPFDAKGLAAEIDRIVGSLADASAKHEADCPAMLDDIERILAAARGSIDEVKAAQKDPERAKQLTAAMRAYDDRGRTDAIAIGLAVCFRQHRELQDRVQRVVDSMPTL